MGTCSRSRGGGTINRGGTLNRTKMVHARPERVQNVQNGVAASHRPCICTSTVLVRDPHGCTVRDSRPYLRSEARRARGSPGCGSRVCRERRARPHGSPSGSAPPAWAHVPTAARRAPCGTARADFERRPQNKSSQIGLTLCFACGMAIILFTGRSWLRTQKRLF